MDDLLPVVLACIAVAVYLTRWYTDPLCSIPTVGGPSLPGLSYIGAFRALGDFRAVLEEGYRKYPDSAFKIATFDRWLVVVSGRGMVEDLRKRPADEISAPRGFQENFQSKYVLEPAVLSDRYHGEVAKEKLLKKLPSLVPDIIDEVFVAVDSNIPAGGDYEWKAVDATRTIRKILAQASNRTFVGLPLCRNDEYLALAVGFATHFAEGAGVLRLVPDFMKPILAPFVNNGKDDIARAVAYLRPIIEERMKTSERLGETWKDKPNDFLQSMLDRAIQRGEAPSAITQRLFMFNFASIATSSSVVTHALYHIAENPELAAALREEARTCVAANGWTGAALGSMWTLDSLLRETLRFYGVGLRGMGLVTMTRKVLKDLTLHDARGTRLPAGTLVSVNAHAMHHDPAAAQLEDADEFDALRYARMRSAAGQSLKHQFAVTSPDYIPFGHGPRACPGRFFASNTLKAVLAYIVLRYDLKLAGHGARPPNAYISLAVVPARDGRVMFKRREGAV